MQLGDHLVMDFEGYLDGEPSGKWYAKDYPVRVGEKKMIAGLKIS